MTYQEKQNVKMLMEENRKLKEENKTNKKEIVLLNKQIKSKEEVIHDLDKYDYRGKYEHLTIEHEELKKKHEKLKLELETLRNSLNKDSSNSCKPSSTNGFKKVVQNNREKTGRKPGREKGYKKEETKYIEEPTEVVEVANVNKCSCGCCELEEVNEVRRQVVGIKIIPVVKEYKGKKLICQKCKKEYNPKFPEGINNPINYDSKLKSVMTILNTYANMPERVVAEIMELLTDNKIQISAATVGNTVKEFHKLSQGIIKDMKEEILKAPVINNDETPINVNGKINQVLGAFTPNLSIMEAYATKSKESFVEMNILNRYTGISLHDHNPIHNLFLASIDAECNFHVIRKAKEQYILHKHESIKEWIEFMLAVKLEVDVALSNNKTRLDNEEIKQIRAKYLEILDKWDKEYNEAIKGKSVDQIKYYNDERNLKNRLRECIDAHLRFIENFEVDFTNNLAERGFRRCKTKQKVIGAFRQLEGAKKYCTAMSIIQTCKKKAMNILESINSVFCGATKIFDFQQA